MQVLGVTFLPANSRNVTSQQRALPPEHRRRGEAEGVGRSVREGRLHQLDPIGMQDDLIHVTQALHVALERPVEYPVSKFDAEFMQPPDGEQEN